MSESTIQDLHAEDGIALQAAIDAPIETVWSFLRDPANHARIDGSQMVRAAVGQEPLEHVGQVFVMEMLWTDGTTQYRTENHVTRYDLEHRLEWLVADEGQEPQGWAWGWILRSTPEDTTEVVNYCDWSQTSEQARQAKGFPVVEKEKIEATLHRLADELS